MKPILIISFLFLFAISSSTAQEKPSREAEAFFKNAMSAINPRHVAWVKTTANTVHEKNMTNADVKIAASNYGVSGNLQNGDIEALCFLVLMQASKSAQEDLKSIMARVKSINEQKQKQRDMLSKMKRQPALTDVQVDTFTLLRSKTIALQKHQNPDTVKLKRSVTERKQVSKLDMDVMAEQMKNDLDSMSEIGEIESLKLQLAMDKQSQLNQIISNILRDIAEYRKSIIQNLR